MRRRDHLAQEMAQSVDQAAPRLLGALITHKLPDGRIVSGRIVEVEAYDQEDPASHAYPGPTERNRAMYGPAGRLYVYFIYGMHYCANVTAGSEGHGAGILIRAIEPVQGADVMRGFRHGVSGLAMTNGPAKTTQALGIGPQLYGHDLSMPPLTVELREPVATADIIIGTRIGITKAADTLRRFYLRGNPYVSRPR